MNAQPKPLDADLAALQKMGERMSRTEAAYRGATAAHERVKQLDAELHQAFSNLEHAQERMNETGASLTVTMSAPLAAAWSLWKQGNRTTTLVGKPFELPGGEE